MRAYTINAIGDRPQLTDIAVPEPAAGQVRIDIKACGLNFADLLMQSGTYQDTPPAPFTLGMEVSGVVSALGPDTKGANIGDRVAVFGGQGGLAEHGCYDVSRLLPLPDTMDFETAAAFQIAYGTSHVALGYRARLQPGETLLVLCAAGGVGLPDLDQHVGLRPSVFVQHPDQPFEISGARRVIRGDDGLIC